jgi:hypothetical protein
MSLRPAFPTTADAVEDLHAWRFDAATTTLSLGHA